ncbi:VOC family protein [Algoriphagus sp. CAU 1675]|uniref:VOC family protein n=1 Tax=Algoriphagus sp. CAU 1675 TaxID=3032597 RepID=UPI0023DB2329|nr:VOC family protein [Algoriphagus sp. CAU 1675]MDF2156711.1 VOC family protein [Algoriphagus sp. CAU 1675]
MTIEHLAIWVNDLERIKDFYCNSLGFSAGEKYTNAKKGFSSYFLSTDSGSRLELMHRADIPIHGENRGNRIGLAHFALSLGSKELVDAYTHRLRKEGVTIIGEPRTTGDGYYESIIEDPEGNWIELTV